MRLILTPYMHEHDASSLEGWADYLTSRGDITDGVEFPAEFWTGSEWLPCTVVYRADPPRLELVGDADG